MLTICLGLVLTTLDSVIANIALPAIVADLHTTPSATVWAVTAYQLAVTVCILPFAKLGEMLGFRRVYMAGLVVFGLASAGCALAPNLPVLVVARALQGAGGAGLVSVSLALVRHIYPRARIGRGLGLYATCVATAMAAGPSVAAGILSFASWPWLFAVNVPIAIFPIAVGLWALPATPRHPGRFDWTAAGLNAVALTLLVSGTDALGAPGEFWLGITALACAVLVGALLVRLQASRAHPLVPVDLMRIRLFALSALTSTMAYATLLLAFVALPFFLMDVVGRGLAISGLLITPWPLGTMIGAMVTGRLSDRYPAGILASLGLLALCTGLVLLATLPAGAGDASIALRMAIGGLGFGFFQTPNNRTLMTAGPPERSGAASGILATARLLGMSLGSALAAVLLALAGTAGSHLALWVGAGMALSAALVSASRLR
jgi:DHA2 family multidrug resistance protein-like MFS transporter